MSPIISTAGAEFLEHYQRDVPVRWSPEDLVAQREFVNRHVGGRDWADWSTPTAALQLVQTVHVQTAVGAPEKHDVLVLAGAIVELVEPATLFHQAAPALRAGGKLVGILPCLRDNSPESQQFIQHSVAMLWPYWTAEELLEILHESGWEVDPAMSGFVAIRRFNEAVLKDELGFKGFNRVFARLAAEGYDPMEIGWGELRFVATLNS